MKKRPGKKTEAITKKPSTTKFKAIVRKRPSTHTSLHEPKSSAIKRKKWKAFSAGLPLEVMNRVAVCLQPGELQVLLTSNRIHKCMKIADYDYSQTYFSCDDPVVCSKPNSAFLLWAARHTVLCGASLFWESKRRKRQEALLEEVANQSLHQLNYLHVDLDACINTCSRLTRTKPSNAMLAVTKLMHSATMSLESFRLRATEERTAANDYEAYESVSPGFKELMNELEKCSKLDTLELNMTGIAFSDSEAVYIAKVLPSLKNLWCFDFDGTETQLGRSGILAIGRALKQCAGLHIVRMRRILLRRQGEVMDQNSYAGLMADLEHIPVLRLDFDGEDGQYFEYERNPYTTE